MIGLPPATFSLHHRKRSAKDGASFVFKKSWQVFAENLREKVAGMQLFPAFQGSAFAPFLRNGCAALPIGARLNFLACSFFLRSQAHHPF